jgi:uncharacterized protein (DUF362 family)
MSLLMNAVFCSRVKTRGYGGCKTEPIPEFPHSIELTPSLIALRSLFMQAGLDPFNQGLPKWNPLGDMISAGEKVVIKPNWVHHRNGSNQGLDCLITHTSVIEAILLYVTKTNPQSITICDAPIQSCDFNKLVDSQGIYAMKRRISSNSNVQLVIRDLRRTIRQSESLSDKVQENCRPLEDYILFDLGSESLLEPVTDEKNEFRVTMYHPDLLQKTHLRGRHQYLVARDIIEADVVINVPKLKTHKKACLTGALKNIVGINGHKEYLPHHRKGGSANGGDCYEGQSLIKTVIENLLDATNRAQGAVGRSVLAATVRAAMGIGKVMKVDNNYEGSWCGNDTVWRMCLDLQRVLHYGRLDGTLNDHVQRKVLTITDAIVAGEGNGPLSPTPVDFRMMTVGTNPAAVDWVHAILMGLNPENIPLTRGAFGQYRYPLTQFSPADIVIQVDGNSVECAELFSKFGYPFRLPSGWDQHSASSRSVSEAIGEPA